jgi:hypothetical protein
MESRYDGKPFLRLVECYALEKVGCLSDRESRLLKGMTKKLQDAYGRSGTWIDIVKAEMQFSDAVDVAIHDNWMRWCAQYGDADPESFARHFADTVIRHS